MQVQLTLTQSLLKSVKLKSIHLLLKTQITVKKRAQVWKLQNRTYNKTSLIEL